jgi:hypothetical protein
MNSMEYILLSVWLLYTRYKYWNGWPFNRLFSIEPKRTIEKAHES